MVQMNRSYGMWPPSQQFRNPNSNPGAMKPPPSGFNKSLAPRNNWKGKKVNKPNDKRRTEQQKSLIRTGGNGNGGVNIISGGNLNFKNFNPPTLNELQHQNRLKTRKFFPKKKFNKNMNISGNNSRELLVDMAKEEWGVDGYGSMKGLIRLRSPGQEMDGHDDDEEDEGGSSGSDVEEHVEVERRLDHDLSRFEMIYNPNSVNVGGVGCNNVLENRVDDQDSHIAQLEEENLILKERLFLMERELGDLRRDDVSRKNRKWRGDKSEKNIADMNDDENYEDRCVDEEVKVKDNVDGECCEHEMVGDDVCMLEDGVGKDYIDLEKDAAN
ncbi:hypothetical protein DH2020_020823 [Rehmannia glutinosa]|uniref:PRLI-interacting factor A n=1 Tax=Rehmannia glutinosa TaxID=99300 RepID=A0ABR0WAX1_REHGL